MCQKEEVLQKSIFFGYRVATLKKPPHIKDGQQSVEVVLATLFPS